jgi:hypothetical protein
MTGLVLLFATIALVFTSYFGPTLLRSKVRRRLRSGSSVLAEGATVTLSGTIRETVDLIEAPLSARRGVFVHAVAILPEADVDGPVTLRTQRMVPFEIDTDAGVVLVDGTEADLEIKPTPVVPRDSDRERAFVVAHRRGAEVARVATFREFVLVPGMRVAVHGVAKLEAGERGERGYRDAAPARARIIAGSNYPLAIGKALDR